MQYLVKWNRCSFLLAMMALNIQPDDEIITTPFTFFATAETIAFLKARNQFR